VTMGEIWRFRGRCSRFNVQRSRPGIPSGCWMMRLHDRSADNRSARHPCLPSQPTRNSQILTRPFSGSYDPSTVHQPSLLYESSHKKTPHLPLGRGVCPERASVADWRIPSRFFPVVAHQLLSPRRGHTQRPGAIHSLYSLALRSRISGGFGTHKSAATRRLCGHHSRVAARSHALTRSEQFTTLHFPFSDNSDSRVGVGMEARRVHTGSA
jgi:hypothetical protein